MADDFLKQLYDFVDGSVRYHLESPDNLKDFLTYLAGMRTDVSSPFKKEILWSERLLLPGTVF